MTITHPQTKADIQRLPQGSMPNSFRATDLIEVSLETIPFDTAYGRHYWDANAMRCARCDSRYCTDKCMAGAPNYAYVTGAGWLPLEQAWHEAEADAHLGLRVRIEFYPTTFDPLEAE